MAEDRLTELYRAYGPVIYARCRRLLADAAAAEDATQETFMRVHRHLDKADSRDALAWIYRIATNLAISELRKRKRRRLVSLTGFFQSDDGSEHEFTPADERPLYLVGIRTGGAFLAQRLSTILVLGGEPKPTVNTRPSGSTAVRPGECSAGGGVIGVQRSMAGS